MENLKTHFIHLENGQLKIGGVESVQEFDESEVKLKVEGRALKILGSELAVSKVSLEDGQLAVSGKIREISYDKAQVPLFKRLLK